MSTSKANKASVNRQSGWGVLNRFGFGGKFLFYFAAFAIVLILCLGGILYLIFSRISTQGNIEARLDRIQYETYPAISNFDKFELTVYSGNITSLCGYLEFLGDSFEARDEDGKAINIGSAESYVADSQIGWIMDLTEVIDDEGTVFSFDSNRFENQTLELSLPFGKHNTSIWVDGYYKFEKHEGQEEAFLRCDLKSGTIISFKEAVQFIAKQYGEDVAYDDVKEIVLTNDCIVYSGFNARGLSADLQSLTDEARVSLLVGGDNPHFALQVSNAHGVDVSGSGELNYYMNDSNEFHEIHSQSIRVEQGNCDVFYTQSDGVEALRVEGVADDLLVSGQGRKPRMLSWIWNNIGLLPASLLTIFGGAITFAEKMADKFDMDNETNDNNLDNKCLSPGDTLKAGEKTKKQRKRKKK